MGVSPPASEIRDEATFVIVGAPATIVQTPRSSDAAIGQSAVAPDAAVQSVTPIPNMPSVGTNFEGLNSQDNANTYAGTRFNPPNVSGDVGIDHYVQVVDRLVRVYAKATGTPAGAPFKMSSLFTGLTGNQICSSNNDNYYDALILYDQLADRWILTQSAYTSTIAGTYFQCIAISTSPDPTGTYNAFRFQLPGTYQPRSAKFGVWPDGYYMAYNQFNNGSAYSGVRALAFDRAKMLDPSAAVRAQAAFVSFNLGSFFTIGTTVLGGMLPADFEGTAATQPAAGTPNYFAMLGARVNYFDAGGATDTVRLFAFHADFTAGGVSTFIERPESPVAVAAYDIRSPSGPNDIEQPAPATAASYLDAGQDRLQHRLVYRNFTTAIPGPGGANLAAHESLVVAHTVNVGSDPTTTTGHRAAVRYYEFRRTGSAGSFTAAEQATFAPDTDNRWMGSAAIDVQGNIAIGYSISSLLTFPSIRYAGRLATDPANGLYQGESELTTGSGVQLDTGGRWGDYSSLSIDPTDGCTFWYTTEYYTAASQGLNPVGWLTHIGSFKFPGCPTSTAAGTIRGYVKDASTLQPIAGARVAVTPGTSSSYTDATGYFTQSLAPSTYTVTASATGYGTVPNAGVVVTAGAINTLVDFFLPVAPSITTQPASQIVNAGDNATFTFTAIGSPAPTLQWQVSTDGGTTFNDLADNATYSGSTTGALTITNVTAGLNNNQYRGRATNAVGTATTNAATLTLTAAPTITTQPTSQTITSGQNTAFTVAASGNPTPGIQWQQSIDAGVTFNNLANSATYSGVTTATLTLTSVPAALHLTRYRAVATNSAGTATSNAATLTLTGAPTFTTHPADQSVAVGQNTSFTVAATGSPTPTLQWQRSTDGGTTFANLSNDATFSGVSTATVTVTNVATGMAGHKFRAIATNSIGLATSNAGTLTLNAAPTFTTQPANLTIISGGNGSFTAAATGSPAPTLQWQVSTNAGASFTDLVNDATYSGVTTGTLTLTNVTTGLNGNQYRAVATNSAGSTMSSAATLTVSVAPAITTQPANLTVGAGANGSFTAAASGNPTPTFQWQLSGDGGATFTDVVNSSVYGGATTATLTIAGVATGLSGNQYRVVATNSAGSATSTAATLTVTQAPVITTQPTSQSVALNGNTSFTVAAAGTPAPTIQWQVSVGGGAFTNLTNTAPYSGVTTTTLTVTNATAGLNGNQYRAVATNASGSATSNAATLTLTGFPEITTQPFDTSSPDGTPATFTVVASGSSLTYQWQQSIDAGVTFNNLADSATYSGVTTTALTISSVTVGLSGSKYRVIVTNSLGTATSNIVTLTITVAPAITSNPTNLTIAAGANGSFTAAANGSPAPTFQWQLSSDGGAAFVNAVNSAVYSGATTATLTITAAPAALDGNRYRAVATNSTGTATSTAATLTVTLAPAITTQPADQAVAQGANGTFTVVATGNPAPTYQWQLSVDGGASFGNITNNATYSGATTASLGVASVLVAWNGQHYRVVVSNSGGAVTSSAAVLSVTVPAAITLDPVSATIAAGGNTTFTVTATGTPAPTYRWQLSSDGGATFTNLTEQAPYSGVTTPTLTVTNAIVGMSGNQYRCVATNTVAGGTVVNATSNAATLTVTAAPTITTHPTDQLDVTPGNNAVFNAAANGSPAPTIQWQVSVGGGAFVNVGNNATYSGAQTPTLTVTAATGLHLNQYRAVATNSTGTATSNAAVLTLAGAPTITTQPASQTTFTGANTSFSVVAAGTPTLTYQWQVSTGAYVVSTVAGTGVLGDVNQSPAQLNQPFGVAVGIDGTKYVADTYNHAIRKITTAGVVTVLAGAQGADAGASGLVNANGAAARFLYPVGIAVDSSDNVYVGDWGNCAIRNVTPAGDVTTLAGSGTCGIIINATGTAAQFSNVYGVAVGPDGAVYVADAGNHAIRKVTSGGVVTTFAGTGVSGGLSASPAQFNNPGGVAVDASGTVYVADTSNHAVRKITSAGVVTTLAGNGTAGPITATSPAQFSSPWGIAVNSAGTVVYVADTSNHAIRRVSQSGNVLTIAGTGAFGAITADPAQFNSPYAVAVDGAGTVLIADTNNSTVRQASLWADVANVPPYGGVTADTLTVTSAPLSLDRKAYRVMVTNGVASAISNAAALRVFEAPSFTTNPINQTVAAGANASFTVAASGNPPPGFQWQVSTDGGMTWSDLTNAAPYGGVTTTTLTVTNVTLALNGFRYRAVATNSAGSATSFAATLAITGAPLIASQPFSVTVASGVNATFSVFALGTPAPTYQWQRRTSSGSWTDLTNVAPYSGVTTTMLTITGATAGLNGNQFRAVATNSVGAAISNAATLTVTNGTLNGQVYIAGTSPRTGIAGAVITIYPGGLSATTDGAGLYTRAVPSGTLTVMASAPGYALGSASVVVGSGATVTQDFSLTPTTVAVYDATLKAPKCSSGSASACDSGTLLVGRDTMSGGAETNQPNTILNSCQDGTLGGFHSDESIDHLRVSTVDGTAFSASKIVRIDATVWVFSSNDFLDLFYTTNPSASQPTWTYLTTLQASGNQLLQTLSATYVLPSGGLQAVRGNYRYGGNPATCTAGGYDERDDLIFTVGSSAAASGTIVTLAGLAGSAGAADGPGNLARFNQPFGVAVASDGTQYIADNSNHAIRRITPAGVVSTFAGLPGTFGNADGPGNAARFRNPGGIAVDSSGTVYVSDTNNHVIKKITPVGVVTTFAGSGSAGATDATGIAAQFNFPYGLTVDGAGNVYVADYGNHAVRKITPAGVVTTYAGLAGPANSGDSDSTDGTGATARFNNPVGVAVDAAGAILYVADSSNNKIKKIVTTAGPVSGAVTTFAGDGTAGSGDTATPPVRFNFPTSLAVNTSGDVYVTDYINFTIRKITAAGVATTFAGTALANGNADGVGAAARFGLAVGIAVDAAGRIYVTDSSNHTIRRGVP
ncbi:MAG: hypothetical protein A3H95_05125 [Acidobacteria bacterium RIFCSPLOWO2_02_FULL_64_15]|nr:MAG: hypothetical protein A3H95_05125 [Acidobacteria bacterium RIFCSPLOWO2_02_FULL_64_15]